MTICAGAEPNFCSLLHLIVDKIATPVMFLLLALSLVYFLAGMLKYVQAAGNEDSRREAITMIVSGLIGLFVMVSVWGLVNLLRGTFPGLVQTDFPAPRSLIK